MNISDNRSVAKYTRGEQLKRIIWMLVGSALFRFSFRTMFGWRRMVLRVFGAKIGQKVNIYRTVEITMPWNLEVGDWSAIGEHALVYNLGRIMIGESVTISQRAHLCAGTHDYNDPAMPLLKPPITIGDKAWVCADAFVGPDVTIGEGAIVGARAVAMKDVDSWTIVAGNPAKTVKTRQEPS